MWRERAMSEGGNVLEFRAPESAQTVGAALAPLSPLQRQRLAALAAAAFKQEYDLGRVAESTTFDDWRHQQCRLAAARAGLREAVNEDFLVLMAHFLRLLGRRRAAARCTLRAATEPRTWALARLRRECERAADVLPQARQNAECL